MALVAGAMFASCSGNVEVIANANDASLGTVTGGGKYEAGASVVLTATPNADAAFAEWSDGVKDNPRTIIVPAVGPVTYTANFVAKGATVSMNGGLNTTWKATSLVGTDYSAYKILMLGAFKNYDSASEPFAQGYVPSLAGNTNSDDYYMFYYENEDDITVDTDGSLSGQAGANLPNWQPKDFVCNIAAIDLNANTITGTVEGELFYLPDYLTQTTTTATLNVNLASAVWEAGAKCKPMGKRIK